MNRLIVLIPEGIYVNYFVYSTVSGNSADYTEKWDLRWSGKIRFRGVGESIEAFEKLIGNYEPEAVAIRCLYGGEEFKDVLVYNESEMHRLKSLIPRSPLHAPATIKLVQIMERIIPTPEILIYFETAFFTALPKAERTYAIDGKMPALFSKSVDEFRKFGYHGLFHNAVLKQLQHTASNPRRIISICLEPVPEVVAIYDGKPVMVSSGSTPLEGLPGNTSSGEIDPGIILFLAEKKGWGPEIINDMLTKKSGLTSLAEKHLTISDIFVDDGKYEDERKFFEYKVLLNCGAAVGVMNGVDAIAFSGRYIDAADKLFEFILQKLAAASVDWKPPYKFVLRDTLDRVIADDYRKRRNHVLQI
jgi:acetate kinase